MRPGRAAFAHSLRKLALLLLIVAIQPHTAWGQTCSRYLNASDGSDSNPGTSTAQAYRSFEYAFEQSPSGTVVCTAAGEYIHGLDEDGIQLQGTGFENKSIMFLIQDFAHERHLRFSEDELLVDLKDGLLIFRGQGDHTVFLGEGQLNTIDHFPNNTTFLHSISLLSGMVRLDDVEMVVESSVGNPNHHERSPETAAVIVDAGILQGSVRFVAAPRTHIYRGSGDRVAGVELPASVGAILLEHESGEVAIGRVSLTQGGRIELRGNGDARITGVETTSAGSTRLVHWGTGRLELSELEVALKDNAGELLVNEREGTLRVGSAVFRNDDSDTSVRIVNRSSGTLSIGHVSKTLPDAGFTMQGLIANESNGQVIIQGQETAVRITADVENTTRGRIILESDVRLEGSIANLGTLDLQSFDLELSDGDRTLHGTVTSTTGSIVLAGQVALSGSARIPNLHVRTGHSTLEMAEITGLLEVGIDAATPSGNTGDASLTLRRGLQVGGQLRINPDAALHIAAFNVVLRGAHAEHLVRGSLESTQGSMILEAPAVVRGAPQTPSEIASMTLYSTGTVSVEQINRIRILNMVTGTMHLDIANNAPMGGIDSLDVQGRDTQLILASDLSIHAQLRLLDGTFHPRGFDLIMARGSLLFFENGRIATEEPSGAIRFVGSGSIHPRASTIIPRLEISGTANTDTLRIESDLHVSDRLSMKGGVLDLRGHVLTLSGPSWNHHHGAYAGPGGLRVTGATTATLHETATVPTLEIDLGQPQAMMTLAGALGTGIHVLEYLLLSRGTVSLDSHDLIVSNRFEYRAGAIVDMAGTGLVHGVSTSDYEAGELVFMGSGSILLHQQFLAPHVRFEGTPTLTSADRPFILYPFAVSGRCIFGEGVLNADTDGLLVLKDGAHLIRRGSRTLPYKPTFEGVIDVAYETEGISFNTTGTHPALEMGNEIPDAPGLLRDLTIDAGSNPSGIMNTIQLTRAIHVHRRLKLVSGNVEPSPMGLTLAPGVQVIVDRARASPPRIGALTNASYAPEGSIDLIVRGSAGDVSLDAQLIPETTPIRLLRIEMGTARNGSPFRAILRTDQAVASLIIDGEDAPAGLWLSGNSLSVSGDASIAQGVLAGERGSSIQIDGTLSTTPKGRVEGSLVVSVAGDGSLQGPIALAGLSISGNLAVHGSFEGNLTLRGAEQTLLVEPHDQPPFSADLRVDTLVIDLEGTVTRERGPRVMLRSTGKAPVTLAAERLILLNGLLETGSNDLWLPTEAAIVEHRTEGPSRSHVAGWVSRSVEAGYSDASPGGGMGRLDFPVGSGYPNALYRPLALTFTQHDAAASSSVIRVGTIDTRPRGLKGFPLGDDADPIVAPAALHWVIESSPSFPESQSLNVELTATGLPTERFEGPNLTRMHAISRTRDNADVQAWSRIVGTGPAHVRRVTVGGEEAPHVHVPGAAGLLTGEATDVSIGLNREWMDFGIIQAIHGSPDPRVDTLDFHLGNQQFADDLAFGQATHYTEVEPGYHWMWVTQANGPDEGRRIGQATFDVEAGQAVVVIASGMLDNATPTDVAPFDLHVNPYGKAIPEEASEDTAMVGFFHGVPDLDDHRDVVDFTTRHVLFRGISFGDFSDYVPLPADRQLLTTRDGAIVFIPPFSIDLTPAELTTGLLLLAGLDDPARYAGAPPVHILFVRNDGVAWSRSISVGSEEQREVEEEESLRPLPSSFRLQGNYPNPFNPSTRVVFDLPVPGEVSVDVYDLLGRRVWSTPPERFPAGSERSIDVRAGHLGSGVYVYQVVARTAGDILTGTGRMVLLK